MNCFGSIKQQVQIIILPPLTTILLGVNNIKLHSDLCKMLEIKLILIGLSENVVRCDVAMSKCKIKSAHVCSATFSKMYYYIICNAVQLVGNSKFTSS